ncbi:MAG: hypothetical protein WBC73_19620 [Phormidesmis sp.]
MTHDSQYRFSNVRIDDAYIEDPYAESAVESTVPDNKIDTQKNVVIKPTSLKHEVQMLLGQAVEKTPIPVEQQTMLSGAIEQTPQLKQRLQAAFAAGGIDALRQIFDHPVTYVPMDIVKEWLEVCQADRSAGC